MRVISCASRSRYEGKWYYKSHLQFPDLGNVANSITRVPKDSMVLLIYET